MKLSRVLLVLLLSTLPLLADEHASSITPNEALERLIAGNKRFAHAQSTLPRSNTARRIEISKKQHPFAVIVGCSDSRVPPETVFDEGLGDLFVVRTAGNVVSNLEKASIEYAVIHLGTRLVVVMGHQRCGAVEATILEAKDPGHIADLLETIEPAVEKARTQKGNFLDNAVRQNIRDVVTQLKADKPVLADLVKTGKVEIVGAYYNLDTGTVTFLDAPKDH